MCHAFGYVFYFCENVISKDSGKSQAKNVSSVDFYGSKNSIKLIYSTIKRHELKIFDFAGMPILC
jgi:hypothetical protein